MPRSNKPICTKNPTNPRNFANPQNKMSKSENLSNKTPKKPTNWAIKKNPNPNFAHKIMKRKKPKPHRLWIYKM